MDLQQVGLAIGGGMAAGAGSVLIWWHRRTVEDAQNRASVAQADASRARSHADEVKADAESSIYRLLVERMNALEKEVERLTHAESESRLRERSLEEHIFHLENLMRRAGMDVPERVRKLG